MASHTERVLFVHAHPDDETLSTGGTIATLVDRGAAVTVLTCTGGEGGDELSRAMAVLGVTDHRHLPDSEQGEVAVGIAAVIRAVRPDVVVGHASDDGDPDHALAHEAAVLAAEVMAVPFFAIDRPDATGRGIMRVDVAPVLDRKRAALDEYRSHLTAHGESEPIATVETFRRIHSQPEQSLAGRIGASIVAALVGALAGVTLTVAHQASIVVAGVPIPWGIIAAVTITAALIAGLRLVFGTRVVAASGAVGLLAASAFLALQPAGGSVLVPANPAGYTWTFAPVLIALLVLGWPRVTRPTRVRIEEVPAAKGLDHP